MSDQNLFYQQLEEQSDADYVKVVRCKDCEYSKFCDRYLCNLWSETGIDVFEDCYCFKMGRLVDADELKAIRSHDLPYSQIVSADCDTDDKVSAYKLGWNDAIGAIVESAPTVDAVPLEDYKSMERTVNKLTKAIADAETVRHGHWEVVDETEPRRYGCSVCKRLSWTEDNYCSYCGAKMDEVEDGV